MVAEAETKSPSCSTKPHHLGADLDQLLLQARQRPVLDRLRPRQRVQEIAELVGERMKLEPHGVGRKCPS